jgi:hypothetical protein
MGQSARIGTTFFPSDLQIARSRENAFRLTSFAATRFSAFGDGGVSSRQLVRVHLAKALFASNEGRVAG